ncbi:MAG TPA: hypothetical protein VGY98_09630 [Verrucomicrobiae bacterium]|nr:hypothetical protein [Verrucomicrobiae bacterium]
MPRWKFCNILHTAFDSSRLWQYEAKGNFKLQREARLGDKLPMPANLVAKSWNTLWQPKLNVAWLPAGTVFLRVIELPKGPFEETVAMVELQLEKLSPQPVAQIVWTIHTMPQPAGEVQTVIVVMAARSAVEEFLGHLEGKNFMPDRLETPMLDQLEATSGLGDGAFIWAAAMGDPRSALVAWWYGGILRGVHFILLPSTGDRAANLKTQLAQLVWHGELEGWLTAKPAWHLIADGVAAAEWEALLRTALDEPVKVTAPLPAGDLAVRTARRAAQSLDHPVASLLPPEHSNRYREQYRDRLWLHGLYAAGLLYLAYVAFYFGMTQIRSMQYDKLQGQVGALTASYNNAMQLQAQFAVLQQRQTLKFAALDCWKTVADNLPEGVTLERFGFGSEILSLAGSAPQDQIQSLDNFGSSLQKAKNSDGQAMFKPSEPMGMRMYLDKVDWNLTLKLAQNDSVQ